MQLQPLSQRLRLRTAGLFCLPAVIACLTFLSASAEAQAPQLQKLEQEALRSAATHVADSVVQIETLGGLEKVGRVLVGTGPTTGLIVSEDGYIVSSAFNFIQNPASILVTLPNGDRKAARVISRDKSRMLVLLKVEPDQPLTVPVPATREQMSVGQWTVAVGRTFSGSNISISVGILSAKNRIWGRALQTDAKISPGNYGGPLVDLQGHVLGVLVPLSPDAQTEVAGAEWYDSGIGFAVPLTDVLSRLEQLKAGDLKAGILGVSFQGQKSVADRPVIGVVQVNSPAYEAGLKAGDTILEANGVPIRRLAEVRHLLGPLYAGDNVDLVLERGNERVTASATLVDQLVPYEHPFLGILPERDNETGVRVRWVYPDSPAAVAGLTAGDAILQLENEAAVSADKLRERISNYQPGNTVQLQVSRDGQARTLALELAGLPETIPSEMGEDEDPEGERPPAETGEIEIQIPEESNQCVAYVPLNFDARRSYGLLVTLPPPGSTDTSATINRWKPVCEQRDLILLIPQSEDDRRWQPAEEAFVRKTIDEVLGRFPIDSSRVVMHGFQGSAAMSYLVTFKHRDTIRGTVAIDAALPLRMTKPQNDPLQRLAIVTSVSKESRMHDRVVAGVEALRKQKIPVSVIEMGPEPRPLDDVEREMVGRWIDSLDRI